MDLAAARKQLAGMGPGLFLEMDDDHLIVAEAFLVSDDALVCYNLDPEDRAVTFKVSEVSPEGKGLVFDAPDQMYLALYPLPDFIDPAVREDATHSVEEAGRSQETAEADYQEVA